MRPPTHVSTASIPAQVCKLLLGLNAEDPLGALATIDYLALRAGR